MTRDERTAELATAVRDAFGDDDGAWQRMLELDPAFAAAAARLASAPARAGALDAKTRELVHIAVDAAATHLFVPGLRLHVARAIEHGATREEILEVLQLTSTLGIHAANIGVPILVEVLAERGETPDLALDERRERLKAEFTQRRGYWHEFWHELLVLDPDFFDAYLELSGHPWDRGVLEPKLKELIYCAFDVSATHLYVPGLTLHIRNALGLGATPAEVMAVIAIASSLGLQACRVGVPILLEELERAGA